VEKKSSAQSHNANTDTKKTAADLTPKEIDDILTRARQTVKPIVSREAADEIVSDDLLNFRMKTAGVIKG